MKNDMGRSAKESKKSLVFEIVFIPSSILSTAGHEIPSESGRTIPTKYSLVTDSSPVP